MLKILLATALLAVPTLGLASDWPALDWDWGARFGGGAGEFSGSSDAHADLNSLFAALGGQETQSNSWAPAGALGFWAESFWHESLGLKTELLFRLDASHSAQDLGSGIIRELDFQRESLEIPVLLKAGWPVPTAGGFWRPYLQGGLWGDRALSSQERIGIQGDTSQVFDWKGTPNEDWGWSAGAGCDFRIGRWLVGIEGRWRAGMKDLDPKGDFAQRAQGWELVLDLGGM
jgi:hypothetical protein